jgi:ADP-ribose pyrophosphatase
MDKLVEIIERHEIFRKFFRIDEVKLQHRRFDGTMTAPITRLVLNRGDSVAILPHDPARNLVMLCEQFRMPTYDKGPGWLLEIPAGVLEDGEVPEDCARRETLEEIGYAVRELDRIGCVYLSPGGSSERIYIYSAAVSMNDRESAGGGLIDEGEDIRLVTLSTGEAFAKVRSGEIADAKTLIALQWLEAEGLRQRR